MRKMRLKFDFSYISHIKYFIWTVISQNITQFFISNIFFINCWQKRHTFCLNMKNGKKNALNDLSGAITHGSLHFKIGKHVKIKRP